MISEDNLGKPDWFETTLRLQGSVLIMVLPRILIFCGLTLAIVLFSAQEIPIYLQKFGDLTTNVIYNLVLSLLLVFRTNTFYERFWEGRKA